MEMNVGEDAARKEFEAEVKGTLASAGLHIFKPASPSNPSNHLPKADRNVLDSCY